MVQCDFHPTIKDELVSTTLSGQIFTWDAETGGIKGFIECRHDIQGGRLQDDRKSAKNSTKNKHFTSVTLSPNGEFCLGGGNSKNICLYDMKHKVLLKRFAVTQNRSLDGVLLKLNSKNIKEGGVMQHELDEIDSDLEEDAWAAAKDTGLPGAKTPKNLLQRSTRLAVRIKCIKFSPDGTQFAAATTEGLVLYSNKQNSEAFFNPFMIDEQVTLDNIIAKVKAEEFLTALVLALRLNEPEVTQTVYKCIPSGSIPLLVAHMPEMMLIRLLEFMAVEIEQGRQVHWAMLWLQDILKFHGAKLGSASVATQKSPLRALLLRIFSSLQFMDTSLAKLNNQNSHLMQFMINQHEKRAAADEAE